MPSRILRLFVQAISVAFLWFPLSADESAGDLAGLKAALLQGQFREVHSVLVYKDGALVFEEYFRGNDDTIDFTGGVVRLPAANDVNWNRGRPHYVASVTKSVTALIAGIALDALKISEHTPIAGLLPSKYHTYIETEKPNPTIHQLLAMKAGYQWDEWTDQDLVKLWQSDDFADFLLQRPNNGPGENWVYNSAVPNLLLTILEYQLGQPLEAWAKTHFFDKLDIKDYVWHRQPTGVPEGSARLHLRPRDMLTIGLMVLKKGVWQGKQIVPAAWLETMAKKHTSSPSGGYGYFLWLRNLGGIFYMSAEGDGGQYINVFPDQGMVVVMTQGNYLNWPLYRNQAEAIMSRYIFPAVGIPLPKP